MTTPAVIEKGGLELLGDLERNGAISRIGLHLSDPNLSYERAEAIGYMLWDASECLKFAIGDWLLLIEQLFPETWTQMAEAVGWNEAYRGDLMRVSEKVPRSRRRKSLKWSHHRAVAALAPPEQKEWLKKAADEDLSHHQLRDALRGSAVGPSPTGRAPCQCCGR